MSPRSLCVILTSYRHHLTSSYVILRHLTASYVILHHLTSSYVILHHLTSSYVILSHLTSSYVIILDIGSHPLCHVATCRMFRPTSLHFLFICFSVPHCKKRHFVKVRRTMPDSSKNRSSWVSCPQTKSGLWVFTGRVLQPSFHKITLQVGFQTLKIDVSSNICQSCLKGFETSLVGSVNLS